jgi:predicted regulator of Ras-like GTPase activity (Roadblock/LC7/MglB family)
MASPVISKADRNQRVEALLASLVSLRGVTTGAIIDSDGFVTHLRRDFEVDADALGAAAQIVFSAATKAAEQVRQGGTKLILSENKDGLVLLAPLVRGFVLVIVADGSAMLGAVRYEIKESIPEFDLLFS